MADPPKIIALGSVNGHLAAAFKKLAALHAKNRFACCIATGNLFGEADDDEVGQLLAGQIDVPVSTYFTVGTRPFPPRVAAQLERSAEAQDGEDLCPNLHYLGKRSVTKTADGLRIVALGGVLDDGTDIARAGPSADACLPFHTAADASSLKGAHGADILLTAAWPRGVWRGSHVPLPPGLDPAKDLPSSDGVADLVVALRPRYHLTAAPPLPGEGGGEDFFYEREGFFHPERPDSSHSLAVDVTRFLALAAWGNPHKAKSLYAFALSRDPPQLVPAGCTPSPFVSRDPKSRNNKRRAPLEPEPYSRFAQGEQQRGGGRGGHGRNKRSRRSPPPGPDKCFFCLSNPNLPTHMIASVGDDAYLATAKGPLPLPTTFADQGLGFPGHMIIVPLSHAATVSAGAMHSDEPGAPSGAATAASTYAEMSRFREALQAMLARVSAQKLGAVTWEISRGRNVHVHWQVVPLPAALVLGGLAEAAFRVEAANLQLPALEDEGKVLQTGGVEGESGYREIQGDYFRVWIWAEEPDGKDGQDGTEDNGAAGGGGRIVGKTLVMRLDEQQRFDLQYGRKVVAKLLGLEQTRTVWQDCAQTETEEAADVAAFRKAFAPWDFTLRE